MDRQSKLWDAASQMRDDWEYRAEHNANYFVKSDKREWTLDDYVESGSTDVRRLLDGAMLRRNFDPKGKILLELGCGNGRMTGALSDRFGHVHAVDISAQMIEKARVLVGKKTNITFSVGTGVDLLQFPDGTFDYCFSYTVFQHMPSRAVVFGYLAEILRTLKPGGIARIQFNGDVWTLLERYPKKYVVKALGGIVGIKRKSLLFRGYFDTWVGVYISKRTIKRRLLTLGFTDVRIEDNGRTNVWLDATRPLK